MGGKEDNETGSTPGKPAVAPGFTPLFVAPTPAELGHLLPQFEILELLGQGGMGAVYKARQPRLDRFIAIKLLPPLPDDDIHSFAERFEREARAMAQLNHPNIVTVHDFGETEDGLRYIVMEYVDGTDLHKAIASGKVTTAHVLAWVPQICAALSYAHGQNLVHRDIKPANILISKEGQVKVGDFGLAKLVGTNRDMSLTQSQVSMGTPDYAAPEAMRPGADVDQRADLYSFGVVLYEMLTGVIPRGAWKAPSALCPVDPRLDKIVIRAMQPDPDHRYQRMAQISEALEDLKRNPDPPASVEQVVRAVPVVTPVQTKKRMHPGLVALIALGSVGVVVGLILFVAANYMQSVDGQPPWFLGLQSSKTLPPVKTAPEPEKTPATSATRPAPPTGPTVASPGPAEKLRPPNVKDGWVSLLPATGPESEPPGPGWSATVDGLLYNGKGRDRDGRVGSRVFLGPPPPPEDYEFRVEVVDGGLTHPLAVRIPVGNGAAHAVFGLPAPGGGKERYAGLALSASPDPGDPGNMSRHSLADPKGESCRIVVRVVKKGGRLGVEATMNGALAISWAGDPAELAGSDFFRGSAKRLIGLAATHPATLHGVDCRALPPGTWLVHEDESLSVLAKAAPGPGPAAAIAPPPLPVTPVAKIESRIAELRARYEGVENDIARAGFERNMGNLRESYQAALNRTLADGGGSLPIAAAVQRELLRIREKEPLEETDPPEMPDTVKKMREVYRTSSKGFEADLRLATAPILREHITALQTIAADPALLDPKMGSSLKLVTAEAARVEVKLRELLAASVTTSVNAVAAPPAAAVPPAAAPNLSRLPFPPARPQIKGTLVIEPRGRDDEVASPIGKVPGGLSGSVVDVAVGESIIVALKSNGRVSLWGPGASDVIREEIESIDRVSRIALAQRGKFGQLALLLEDGSLEVRDLGTAISGIMESGEETKGFKNLVDVAVTPVGGVALDRDGKLQPWGVFAAFPGMPENVMQLRQAGVGVVALGANGIPVYLTASALPPGWPVGQPVIDIQFGPQEEPGAVTRTPDGRILVAGSFAELAKDLEGLTKTAVVSRFEAGEEGIAVQTEGNTWHLLGTGFRAGLAKSFNGCARVLISKTFVAGLLPE